MLMSAIVVVAMTIVFWLRLSRLLAMADGYEGLVKVEIIAS